MKKRILIAVVALLAVAAGLAFWQSRRIQREATALAETGQTSIRLLNAYVSALKGGELDGVVDLYALESGVDGAPVTTLQVYGGTTAKEGPERDGVAVRDWTAPSPVDAEAGLLAQLEALVGDVGEIELAKFKLRRVESIGSEDEATVIGHLWLRGSREGAPAVEMHGRYRMALAAIGGDWKIRGQELVWGSTVTGSRTGFTDVAQEVGIDYVARHNPLFATDEWYPHTYEIIRYGPGGASAVDFDNDGWYDLFLTGGAGSRLYRNAGDGTFVDVTEEVGLPSDRAGFNVGIFADFDNDGDQDLYLGCFTGDAETSVDDGSPRGCRNLLFRNNLVDPGAGSSDGPLFTDVTDGSGLEDLDHFVVVAAAGDADGDGLLDLYVGRYLDPRTELPLTLFYTRNGRPNSLLRNQGDMSFSEVNTGDIGDTGLALGVAWADADQDGDQDLYVANDFGRNVYLRNDGQGNFEDVAATIGAIDVGYGMSSTFADVDNDGDLDAYVSNVHSGQRWYSQATTFDQYLLNSLRQGTIFEDWSQYSDYWRHVPRDWHIFTENLIKGNSLLLNDGSGEYTDVAEAAGANPFGWYWGTATLDYDNDGLLDIYAANGWISGETYDDL